MRVRTKPHAQRTLWQRYRDQWHDARNVKYELAAYGFVRGFNVHYRQMITVLVMTLLIVVVLGIADKITRAPDVASIVTILCALTAVLLGIEQWRASRDEVTLDRFYDRLEITNAVLDKHASVREFAGPWLDEEGEDAEKRYHRSMYVYRELDNLEYAIAKYRIGFMSHANAYRCLRTFRARCTTSPRFCQLVDTCAKTNLGYDQVTRMVVTKCIAEANMAVFARIGEGMQVQFTDGQTLGKIRQFWVGIDPGGRHNRCDDGICSRLEVQCRWYRQKTLYVPVSAVEQVVGRIVTLKCDSRRALRRLDWHRLPPAYKQPVWQHNGFVRRLVRRAI